MHSEEIVMHFLIPLSFFFLYFFFPKGLYVSILLLVCYAFFPSPRTHKVTCIFHLDACYGLRHCDRVTLCRTQLSALEVSSEVQRSNAWEEAILVLYMSDNNLFLVNI